MRVGQLLHWLAWNYAVSHVCVKGLTSCSSFWLHGVRHTLLLINDMSLDFHNIVHNVSQNWIRILHVVYEIRFQWLSYFVKVECSSLSLITSTFRVGCGNGPQTDSRPNSMHSGRLDWDVSHLLYTIGLDRQKKHHLHSIELMASHELLSASFLGSSPDGPLGLWSRGLWDIHLAECGPPGHLRSKSEKEWLKAR